MGSSNCISNDGKNYKRDDYYDLVEKKMKGAINDNKYNLNNQNISLESADFKSNLYNNLQNTKNKVNFFIPWKSHLIVYLNSLTYNWAKNLLNYIEECNFSNENKFESQLFYEEFKIMTCPKIIKKKEKENKENFKDDINDDTLKNPYLDFSKDLTESILSDDSNNNLIDLRKEDKINKETRKEYCKVFKEQIYKEDHPIYIIITKFNLFFVEEIDNKIEEIKNEENENIIKKNCEDFITQIQDFILEVHIIFKLFYSRTISLSSFSEEKDELINLIIGTFFNIGNFYEKMKKLLFYLNKNKINLYKEKIELFIYCDLIEYFTISSTKNNMYGFYFSTIKGVLNHILEVDDKSKL